MRVELDISDEQARLIGEPLAERVASIVARETDRLWHIERSKPKPKLGVGRPKLAENERQLKQYASDLRAVYLKLKEMYGEDYQAAFAEQEAVLETAIKAGDLQELVRIHTTQPWVRRTKA